MLTSFIKHNSCITSAFLSYLLQLHVSILLWLNVMAITVLNVAPNELELCIMLVVATWSGIKVLPNKEYGGCKDT